MTEIMSKEEARKTAEAYESSQQTLMARKWEASKEEIFQYLNSLIADQARHGATESKIDTGDLITIFGGTSYLNNRTMRYFMNSICRALQAKEYRVHYVNDNYLSFSWAGKE